MTILTVGRIKFYRIPDYFIERYDQEFVKWANVRPFPSTYLIAFNEGDLAERSPDPEQGRVWRGVWLFARISRKGVEIEPFTANDADKIERHCTKMQLAGVPARARLIEPERPGIPTIPRLMN